MSISYRINADVRAEDVADVFKSSGIRRPVDDLARIRAMLEHANLTLTAWDGGRLVGIARALTDFSYCCYLSDLAVRKEYQKQGIGKELVRILRERLGEKVAIILVSAPEAVDYYPRIGFDKCDRAFLIPRTH